MNIAWMFECMPFKLACIGGESEWKFITSKVGAGYFGHNELN